MNFLFAAFCSSSACLDDAPEVLEGELCIHGHEVAAELDDRVHGLAALEPVLEHEVGGREDLRQEIAQEQLAQAAAQFRGAQNLLQARDVLAHVEDLLRGLVQTAQALAHFLHHPGRIVEPRVQVARGLLELLRNLPQLVCSPALR